jgi:glycine reductase
MAVTRIVHYVNQFFSGVGGEDAAGTAPTSTPGPVGPGRRLAQLLGDGYEIVATVSCGDDYAAGTSGAVEEILALVTAAEPDLLVAGPAFTSGRYGLACARLVAGATAAGIPALASMHGDNPGLDEAGGAPVVASTEVARGMGASLDSLAAAVAVVASGRPLTATEGRVGTVPRISRLVSRSAAERAVDLVLARLGGDSTATEVPLPRFDHVTPAAPVTDLANVTVALLTEGGLVPDDNPGNLESARATRWLRYRLDGVESLEPGQWRSVHGGFSTAWANADPHRILPLDVARELESEGAVGRLASEYFVTTGNGTSVGNARRFGIEWAADLHHSEARAAVLTAT